MARWAGLLAILLLGAAAGCGSADTTVAAPAAALPVETARIDASDTYTVSSRHVGQVRARREADLGFTRSDRLAEVLAEEGDQVEQGQALARLDTALLEAQRTEWLAQRREVQARLDLARLTLERRKELAGKDSISTQRYDEARFEAIALEARLASIEAGLERVDIDIADSTLEAPFAGAIIRRSADEGAILAPGAPVVSLVESTAMEVRVGVPSELAGRLAVGDVHTVEIAGKRYPAPIGAILEDVDADTRTVMVILPIAQPPEGPTLRHGELARLVIDEERAAEGYWLPITALTESRRGLWSAYSLAPSDQADVFVVARHELMLIHVESDRAFVRGTLSDGDEIVVTGLQRIAPGQRVQRAAVANALR
jgi:RND family efflux transporter MFP subunit